MSSPALAVSNEQYDGTTKKAVAAAQREAQEALERQLSQVRHRAPKRLARAMRIALNVLDDMSVNELDRLLADPVTLRTGLLDLVQRRADSDPQMRHERVVLGQGGTMAPLSEAEGEKPLTEAVDGVSEEDPLYRTLSTTDVGKRLRVSRQTIVQWVKEDRLIGIRGAKRGIRVPEAQIRRRRPAPGLAPVVAALGGDHELAWHFLVAEQDIGEGTARPLDLLFTGRTGLAARLAKGYGRDVL